MYMQDLLQHDSADHHEHALIAMTKDAVHSALQACPLASHYSSPLCCSCIAVMCCWPAGELLAITGMLEHASLGSAGSKRCRLAKPHSEARPVSSTVTASAKAAALPATDLQQQMQQLQQDQSASVQPQHFSAAAISAAKTAASSAPPAFPPDPCPALTAAFAATGATAARLATEAAAVTLTGVSSWCSSSSSLKSCSWASCTETAAAAARQ